MSKPLDIAATLPNPSIVRELLVRYYPTGGRADAEASSHWQHYSNQFNVVQGEGHTLVSLSGTAFGNARWAGPLHRLADNATIASHLATLADRIRLRKELPRLRRVTQAMALDPTFDAFRQLCSLGLLDRARQPPAPRVVVIGDGHGILSALIKDRWPEATVTLIDLGRTLLFQTVNCQRAVPDSSHVLATANTPTPEGAFIYCPADQLGAISHLRFDIAVNIASMQEMSPSVVEKYFSLLRRQMAPDNLFYCCNRERKVLPAGEVSMLANYPWHPRDRVHLDEPCPWHQYFLAAMPPFIHRYDGQHRHRLVTLAGAAVS